MTKQNQYVDQDGNLLDDDEIEVVKFISQLGEQNKKVYSSLTIAADPQISATDKSAQSCICKRWAIDPRTGNRICIEWGC